MVIIQSKVVITTWKKNFTWCTCFPSCFTEKCTDNLIHVQPVTDQITVKPWVQWVHPRLQPLPPQYKDHLNIKTTSVAAQRWSLHQGSTVLSIRDLVLFCAVRI